MDATEYHDDELRAVADLPADQLVIAFVRADLDRRYAGKPVMRLPDGAYDYESVWVGHNAGGERLKHLAECPERTWTAAVIESATTCGEGTCDYDPQVSAQVRCPHGKAGLWTVSADSMAALLDQIDRFAAPR